MSICTSASALLSAILLALSLGTLSSVREAARFEKSAKLSITFGSGDIDSEDFAERLPYMSNNAHFLYDYAVLLWFVSRLRPISLRLRSRLRPI